MASEPEPFVQLSNVFTAIISVIFLVVGAIFLLAVWLKILDFWSWSSKKVREYRARRGINDAHAQNVENSMVENHDCENGVIDNGMTEWSPNGQAGS